MELSTMVVHPAYWRRGHGSTLANWCVQLADMDDVVVAVSAASMGQLLFEHVGFKLVEKVEVPGYDQHPESISLWIGVREKLQARYGTAWKPLAYIWRSLGGNNVDS